MNHLEMYFFVIFLTRIICLNLLVRVSAKIRIDRTAFSPSPTIIFLPDTFLDFIIQQHRPTLRYVASDADGIIQYTAEIFCLISLLQEVF